VERDEPRPLGPDGEETSPRRLDDALTAAGPRLVDEKGRRPTPRIEEFDDHAPAGGGLDGDTPVRTRSVVYLPGYNVRDGETVRYE
jgi:hypothetical protein